MAGCDWRVVIGSEVNPYLAPSSASFAKRVKRSVLRVLGILLYVSPLGPVVAIYLGWALSWLALGHHPKGYNDYPKNVVITFCIHVGAITWFAAPLIVQVGLVFAELKPFGWVSGGHASALLRYTSLLVFIAEAAAACLLHYDDPQGVMIWYFE